MAHKKGDMREDGKVFVSKQKHLKGGEYWVTPEKFVQLQERAKARYQKNREKILEQKKQYHIENRDRILQNHKEYAAANKEAIRARCRQYYLRNKEKLKRRNSEYYQKNKEQVLKTNAKYQNTKLKEDPLYKFKHRTRTRVWQSFSGNGYTKKSRVCAILGCSYKDFLNHITSQFTEGMTLDNHGDWHLDHILPVAAATTKEEVIALNHYTNFQPMWASDNISKHTKHCPKELKAYLNKMIEVV